MVGFGQILIAISLLFFLFLGIRSWLKIKVCAICAAVSVVWISLLTFKLLGGDVDTLSLGILMGGSAVGLMYLLGAKLSENSNILKLPFLMSLFAAVYLVLSGGDGLSSILVIVAALWILFLPLFFMSDRGGIKKVASKLIECCKNW